MYLQWGDVTFKVIDLQRFDRETVWSEDYTELLYVRATIGVVATYAYGGVPAMTSVTSPSTIANRFAGIDLRQAAPVAVIDNTASVLDAKERGENPEYPGVGLESDIKPNTTDGLGFDPAIPKTNLHTGPETDLELGVRVRRPRQKLILWAYGRQSGRPIKWLESPRPGFTVDYNNGPRCIGYDVVAARGEPSSITVYVELQTDMSPCPSGADRYLLSHRWQMTHECDEDQYLSRVIEGTAVFNTAMIQKYGLEPDLLRNQLIHPIPVGMQRRAPTVSISPDGTTIKYRVVDFDPTITFDAGNSGATRIDIQEKVMYNMPISFMED